jgi:membrane-associated phospholipid phosphatase
MTHEELALLAYVLFAFAAVIALFAWIIDMATAIKRGRRNTKPWLLLLLLVPRPASAQALALPTHGERQAADISSYVTVGVSLALDTKASWDCPDRKRCLLMQAGRDVTTWAISESLKRLIHKERPCEPSGTCGIDAGTGSMPSMHTAFAFSARGGPRLAFSISLGVGTAGERLLAGKHDAWDVLAGAGIGLATSFIR